MEQRRWICRNCNREWVWAHDWDEANGCPVCQGIEKREGADVERVVYSAAFPGSDVPRGDATPVINTPEELIAALDAAQPAPLALVAAPAPANLDLWQMI